MRLNCLVIFVEVPNKLIVLLRLKQLLPQLSYLLIFYCPVFDNNLFFGNFRVLKLNFLEP
jgi:hypothetical protein